MSTLLGYTSVGAEDIGNWDGKCYCRFIALESGTLDTIKWYLVDDPGTYIRLAIYSDNAGAVDDVLAQGTVSSPTAYTWMALTGLSVALVKDSYYWIACNWDGISRRETSGGALKYIVSTGSEVFANDPAPGDLTDNSSKVSCYGEGTITTNVDITAVTMTATAAVGIPDVVAGSDAETLAALSLGSAAAAVPSITAEIHCTVTGAVATAAGESGAPIVDTIAEAEVGPCHNDALFPPPTVTGDSAVTAACAAATADAQVPTVTTLTTAAPPAATATAAFAYPSFFTRWHVILEARYFAAAPDINRAYIVGQTPAGLDVSGSAAASADIALVGERLEVKHDPAIPSATIAGAVAAAVLAAARLDSMHGSIVIPPHCGLELWDVITLQDTVANQDTNYRVTGYTFEYDTRQGIYQHTLDLCAP